MIKLLITRLFTVAILSYSVIGVSNTQIIDQIVAIVDQDVVLASELGQRVNQIKQSAARAGGQLPPEEELFREVLDRLILDSLQLQMASRAGVRISDEQLNKTIERIALQNNLSLQQFAEQLSSNGEDFTQFREGIRKELLIQRVQQGQVSQRIQISEQEIENFLTTDEGQVLIAPAYRCTHVLIALPSGASGAQIAAAESTATALAEKAKGYGLQQAAKDFNLSASLSDLGWRKAQELPSLFVDAIPTLQRGEVHSPIKSSSGFHVIQLEDIRGGQQMSKQTKVRHILVKASAIRDESETENFITKLRDRAVNGEDFALIAKQHSEDIGSAQEGGDLGWMDLGQLVPEFEQIMNQTEINNISRPFKSRYGWHVLQVMDRRTEDVTKKIQQQKIAEQIHRRKFDEELQVWLQKIRDEAFIDIKTL